MATNPEQLLISAILRSRDHVTPAARGITKNFFHAYPDEYRYLERYIATHKRTPSIVAFRNKFPGFRVKDADDVEHFCDEVRHAHVRTEATAAINDVIQEIDSDNLADAIQLMHSRAIGIEAQMGGMSGDEDIFSNWQDTYDEVMRRVARRATIGMSGLPTGFPTLDERTGGPQPGQFWLFASRLGQGKTWTLVRTACAAAFSGYTVQYDALEQTRPEIAMRVHTFASSEYGKAVFKNTDLSMGQNFSPRDYKNFLASMRDEIDGKFHLADTSRGPIGLLTMASQIERNKPDALFVDYIQIMDAAQSDKDVYAGQSLGSLSKGFKFIAQRYGISTIAAAQLNREAARGKGPGGPENLAESDSLGRDADAVVVMRQLSKRMIQMKLAKWRHGRDGYSWYCKFLPNTGHFEEVTFDEAQDVVNEDRDEDDETTTTFMPRKKGSFKEISAKRKATVIASSSKTGKRSIIVKGTTVATRPAKKRSVVVKKR